MTPIYIATSNKGKKKEIHELLEEYFPFFTDIFSLASQNVEETGATFKENALIKARALVKDCKKIHPQSPFWVISDDSGLCVDALQGRPGLYSARYAGDHVEPILHIKKLLTELQPLNLKLEERSARYHCAIALIHCTREQTHEFLEEGICEGFIDFNIQGSSGFGYDPVFYYPAFQTTLSNVSFEMKNSISHRRMAFEKLKGSLQRHTHGS